ncbi:MAG: GNAT family N-acetyltransferase [Actinobacteria bacterium]|jgi:GNAT superfamily N-acetyltransferase|nr:MAG: GNAT family N-acetyltransferase [Actinomycetota bacterium]
MVDAVARHAVVEDLTLLRHLADQSRADRLNERGGAVLELLDPRPVIDHAQLVNPDVLLALGLYGDVAFGYAHAAVCDVDDTRIVRMYDVFVEAEARGVGIGEALLELVFAWAQEQHAAGIDSIVLPGNREGKNFFERFGLVARAIHVYRALEYDE